MKNVLVTGAGGFIGGYLVSKLIKKNFNVICCDIKPKNNMAKAIKTGKSKFK